MVGRGLVVPRLEFGWRPPWRESLFKKVRLLCYETLQGTWFYVFLNVLCREN